MATAKRISERQFRAAEIDRGALDMEKRTALLSFSSEMPVERWFGVEVLDHSPGSCDLSRLNNAAPLLCDHEADDQIGVVEEARIEGGKGLAVVRFSKSEDGEKIWQDVIDGIRRKVSVGYRLTDNKKVVVTEYGGKENYRFMSWQPFEISIVSIPADDSVGVGVRSTPENPVNDSFELPTMKRNLLFEPNPTDGGGAAATSSQNDVKAERARTRELQDIGKQFRGRIEGMDELVEKAIEDGVSADSFSRSLIPKMATITITRGSETASTSTSNTSNEILTPGEALVRSAGYKQFIKGDVKAFNVDARGLLPNMLQRATLTSSGLTSIQKIPGVVLLEQNPNLVANLFGQGTTSSTTIRFTKESSFTNGATAVAEEGQKPEASFALAEADVSVKKYAVIGRVSDEMFSDYEYAQSYVNSRLLYMLQAKEDYDLINGDGSSNSITGVLNVSNIQTQAYSSSVADTIHKAITKVRSTPGFIMEPDALVIHPTDYQNLVLTKDSNGQYYAGGPFAGQYGVGGINRGGPWGLTPVITTSIAQGTAIVGAFRVGATLFRREGIRLETSNSDASDFAYNRIAIRVEERFCLVPYRPLAFCKITGIPSV